MASARGVDETRRFITGLPAQIEAKLLPGVARAAGKVLAEEAREKCIDKEVGASLKVKVKAEPGRVVARVAPDPKMEGAFRAVWIEYGTDPHFVTVSEADRKGRSVGRINRLEREGSLIIAGHFVGPSVWHPGARPFPFLRPALDTAEAAAIAAGQAYADKHMTRSRITAGADAEEDA